MSDEAVRDEIPGRFEDMVRGICSAFGATYEMDYRSRNLPPVISTQHEVNVMRSALHEVFGGRKDDRDAASAPGRRHDVQLAATQAGCVLHGRDSE